MKKEKNIFQKEGFEFFNQLLNSLEKAEEKLEKAYKKNNSRKFNKSKKLMLEIQERISEVFR